VLVVLLRFLIEMEKESTSHFEMLFTRYRQFFIGRKLSTVDAKTFLLTFQAAAFYKRKTFNQTKVFLRKTRLNRIELSFGNLGFFVWHLTFVSRSWNLH
jgi:hypothetical protein